MWAVGLWDCGAGGWGLRGGEQIQKGGQSAPFWFGLVWSALDMADG